MSRAKRILQVIVDRDAIAKLDARAAACGISRAQTIRDLIAAGLSAEKAALRKEISELRLVGSQFANMAFNLSQPSAVFELRHRDALRDLQKQWDGIARAEKRTP